MPVNKGPRHVGASICVRARTYHRLCGAVMRRDGGRCVVPGCASGFRGHSPRGASLRRWRSRPDALASVLRSPPRDPSRTAHCGGRISRAWYSALRRHGLRQTFVLKLSPPRRSVSRAPLARFRETEHERPRTVRASATGAQHPEHLAEALALSRDVGARRIARRFIDSTLERDVSGRLALGPVLPTPAGPSTSGRHIEV